MNTFLLHLDDALLLQPEFLDVARSAGAREADERACGSAIRLWGSGDALDLLKPSIVRASRASWLPRLCFLGSGDFHHVSALLIEEVADAFREPFTVIHIDNHPDWVRFENGMHCGSWVNEVAALPQVQKVISLGICSDDLRRPEHKGANLQHLATGKLELYPYAHRSSRVKRSYGTGASYCQSGNRLNWLTIENVGATTFGGYLLGRIKTTNVYITIDKDVLSVDDAVTNWDQGHLRVSTVVDLLVEIGAKHRIVGADVVGDYSTPYYSGTMLTRLLKYGEVLIDQPKRLPNPALTRVRNTETNLALLVAFSDIMR